METQMTHINKRRCWSPHWRKTKWNNLQQIMQNQTDGKTETIYVFTITFLKLTYYRPLIGKQQNECIYPFFMTALLQEKENHQVSSIFQSEKQISLKCRNLPKSRHYTLRFQNFTIHFVLKISHEDIMKAFYLSTCWR